MDGFVTSSGQTDGLEAYEFDYFTDVIAISGVFSSSGESITISEVRAYYILHGARGKITLT